VTFLVNRFIFMSSVRSNRTHKNHSKVQFDIPRKFLSLNVNLLLNSVIFLNSVDNYDLFEAINACFALEVTMIYKNKRLSQNKCQLQSDIVHVLNFFLPTNVKIFKSLNIMNWILLIFFTQIKSNIINNKSKFFIIN